MSVNPISDKTFENWASRPRPAGLTPIIMSGWVTPSDSSKSSKSSKSSANEANEANEVNEVNEVNENEDIENPSKKRIKVCELPYVQKCEIGTDKPFGVNLFVTEEEMVRETRETCAMAAAILKRY